MTGRSAIMWLWLVMLELLLFWLAFLGLVMLQAVVLWLALMALVVLEYALLEYALVKCYDNLVCWLVLEAIYWLDQIDLLDD